MAEVVLGVGYGTEFGSVIRRRPRQQCRGAHHRLCQLRFERSLQETGQWIEKSKGKI